MGLMDFKYEFYSDGFFGYGEEGDYHAYGLHFFIPVLLFAAAVVFTVLKKDKLRAWKGEKTFRFVLAFVMMIIEMSYYWRVLYVGNGNDGKALMTKLPIQLCEWGAYCAIFMITSLSDTLFGLNFYITLIGAGIAVLFPQTVISNCGPGYFNYYHFWGEHLLPIFSVVYAMIVHEKKPSYRFIWISYAAMLLLTIPATLLNMKYDDANYLYLKQDISFLPDSYGLRIVVYSVLMIILFHILWGIWYLFDRRKRKRQEKTDPEIINEAT